MPDGLSWKRGMGGGKIYLRFQFLRLIGIAGHLDFICARNNSLVLFRRAWRESELYDDHRKEWMWERFLEIKLEVNACKEK